MRCPRCDRQLVSDDRFCSRCGLARSTDGKPRDPLIGITVADRYRIDERIGVGGMGTVYRGTHIRLGQSVAIKVLHERYAGDQKLTRRFEKEALTYGQVTHPNLVGLHDFGRTDDGTFFMVLEYCPGVSLSRLIREQGRLDPMLAGDIVLQIAQGLGAAHDKGIVHRDLKPENVILMETRPGRFHARLLDFGIAKRIDDDEPRLTQAGMVFGTPEYMAPEQARGKTVDERSDIYALGTMLYELLAGDPPFVGNDKLRIMQQQANEIPQPPTVAMPGIHVPKDLEILVMRCIEKQPPERYQSTSDLIRDLDQLLNSTRLTPEPLPINSSSTRSITANMMKGNDPTTRLEDLVQRASTAVDLHDTGPMTLRRMNARPEPPSIASVAVFAGLVCLFLGLPIYHWVNGGDEPPVVGAELPPLAPDKVKLAQEVTQKKAARKPTERVASIKMSRSVNPVVSPDKGEATAQLLAAEKAKAAQLVAEAKAKAAARVKAQRAARALAHLKRAREKLRVGDFDSARREARQVLRTTPKHRQARTINEQASLGLKLAQKTRNDVNKGRCQQAMGQLKKLKRLAPNANAIDEQIAFCRHGMPPKGL